MERRMWKGSGIEVRAKSGEPTRIAGYAARYYDPSDPGTEYPMEFLPGTPLERIMKGAFSGNVNDDVLAVWAHNAETILGRTVSGTLRLRADELGLWYEVDLPDTAAASDLAKLITRGDVDTSSFAFENPNDNWRTENGREIREIRSFGRIRDVSPVPGGHAAYSATSVGMRCDGESCEARASHEKYRSQPTTTKDQAEARLRVIETDSAKYAECGA